MEGQRRRLPSLAAILAWLGVIGTILGIVGFFISDLPNLLHPGPQGLREEDIVATLIALQSGKDEAELQLTQIAVANLEAANLSTRQALDQQQADLQSTLGAIQAEREALVATSNAVAAMTATQAALDAVVTQAALDAAATQAALAQMTPTATPTPTETPTPVLVVDHRSLISAQVAADPSGLAFSVQVAQAIPAQPEEGLAYVWSLDTDRNPATGTSLQDIGVDMRVAVQFSAGTWVGTVRSIQADGAAGEPFFFVDVTSGGAALTAVLDPAMLGLPASFDWVARTELGDQAYSFFPQSGHMAFGD